MVRWEPGTLDRLRTAAMELFADPGYDRVSVAQIAERAGVSERTFFRHFADKREVLFAGAVELQEEMLDALRATPADVGPLDAAAVAIGTAGAVLDGRREFSHERWLLLSAHHDLQERELIKMARLAVALAAALRDRGAGPREATMAAEAAVAVYRTAYEEWMEQGQTRPLTEVMRDSFTLLRSVTASPSP